MSLADVVVMLGRGVAEQLAVLAPFSTSIGLVTSTPVNDWMPPAEPVDALSVQV